MAEVSTEVQINTENSLEKLQDGRDHLCYGLHGGILVTATHNTNNLRLDKLHDKKTNLIFRHLKGKGQHFNRSDPSLCSQCYRCCSHRWLCLAVSSVSIGAHCRQHGSAWPSSWTLRRLETKLGRVTTVIKGGWKIDTDLYMNKLHQFTHQILVCYYIRSA